MIAIPQIDVRPSDFLRATEGGATAGLASARLAQTAQLESARLALEARREAAAAQQAQDHLSQQSQIAQMENESRNKIAEQNHIREMQGQAILNAYRQQQIALHGENLQREEAAAADKARQGAMIFAHTQGYAQEIARGVPPAVALSHYPLVGTASASVLERYQAMKEGEDSPMKVTPIPGTNKSLVQRGKYTITVDNPDLTDPSKINAAQRREQAAMNHVAFNSALSALNAKAKEKDGSGKPIYSSDQIDAERKAIEDKYLTPSKAITEANVSNPTTLGAPNGAPVPDLLSRMLDYSRPTTGTSTSSLPSDGDKVPSLLNYSRPSTGANLSPLPSDGDAMPAPMAMAAGLNAPAVPVSNPPSSPVAKNLYQVGKKYRDLIYLGGDPNSQESWQDANQSGVPAGNVQGEDEGSGE